MSSAIYPDPRDSSPQSVADDFPQHPGKRVIQLKCDRVGPRAGRASLVIDGAIAGVLDIPRTWPTHGTTAGLNCGRDAGAPVSDAARFGRVGERFFVRTA